MSGLKLKFPARALLALGAVNALASVALGAYGAHALKGQVAAESAGVFQTALQYHQLHALGLLAAGFLAALRPKSLLVAWSGGLMVAGIVLFCGGLYLTAITGYRGLGPIAPAGGLAFMVAWGLFAVATLRR